MMRAVDWVVGDDGCTLRVRVDGQEMGWLWRLSANSIAVDLLLEDLEEMFVKRFKEREMTPASVRELYGAVTSLVIDHRRPGDAGYESPNVFRPSAHDLRWAKELIEEGAVAEDLARTRWHHERELRLLRHEVKMMQRRIGLGEVEIAVLRRAAEALDDMDHSDLAGRVRAVMRRSSTQLGEPSRGDTGGISANNLAVKS